MDGFGGVIGSSSPSFAFLAVGFSRTVFLLEDEIGCRQPVEGSFSLGADNKNLLNCSRYFADELHAACLEILKDYHGLLTSGRGGNASGGNRLHIGAGRDFLQSFAFAWNNGVLLFNTTPPVLIGHEHSSLLKLSVT